MRPYEVVSGEWVDLDTVQSISGPQLDAREIRVTLEWRHAFQKEPRQLWFRQPQARLHKGAATEWFPKLTMAGEPTELDRVRREVFEPFFEAWAGRRAS